MDIGLFILVMIVLYVVPELLKRYKKKQPYQYPEFPQTGDQPENAGTPGTLSQGTKPPQIPAYASEKGTPGEAGDLIWAVPKTDPALLATETASIQTGAHYLNSQNAMQGIVWAEIIAPPVSLRRRRFAVRKV